MEVYIRKFFSNISMGCIIYMHNVSNRLHCQFILISQKCTDTSWNNCKVTTKKNLLTLSIWLGMDCHRKDGQANCQSHLHVDAGCSECSLVDYLFFIYGSDGPNPARIVFDNHLWTDVKISNPFNMFLVILWNYS